MNKRIPALLLLLIIGTLLARAQTITGAWRGKINNSKVELKLIKSGDSLSGTAYYYTSKTNYRRYSVKGYFDAATNAVIWWDDWLIESQSSRNMGNEPQLSTADFNCPGEDQMLLEGSSNRKDSKNSPRKSLLLQKTADHVFDDEWDWVIENYLVGANQPYIIDSINHRQGTMPFPEEKTGFAVAAPPVPTSKPGIKNPEAEEKIAPKPPVAVSLTPEEKFSSRKNIVQTVIPVNAKNIELRFYDNAQIDGDSIALFLNNRLLVKNIRLTDKAYTIYLKAEELEQDNELVMVAENLGSIPPNTSFMVAIVGDKRYEARLFANENSSALIRLVKQDIQP